MLLMLMLLAGCGENTPAETPAPSAADTFAGDCFVVAEDNLKRHYQVQLHDKGQVRSGAGERHMRKSAASCRYKRRSARREVLRQ